MVSKQFENRNYCSLVKVCNEFVRLLQIRKVVAPGKEPCCSRLGLKVIAYPKVPAESSLSYALSVAWEVIIKLRALYLRPCALEVINVELNVKLWFKLDSLHRYDLPTEL